MQPILWMAESCRSRSSAARSCRDIIQARFVDIVSGVRVVQAVNFVADDPGYAGTMTMTWKVTATNDGTRGHPS
jgi:hypothetical protein